LSEIHPDFGRASGPVEIHLKVLGNADADEVDVSLTAIPGCGPVGRGSSAKQLGNEQQIAEKHRTEALAKTPFPNIFATDFCRCDLRANDFNLTFPIGSLPRTA
jgi:hypothetical protein